MSTAAPENTDAAILDHLVRRVAELEKQLQRVDDMRAIANVQGRYIYYIQSHQYEKIVALFARKAEVGLEMDDLGKFIGYEKVAAVFLKVLKPLYMVKGAMGLHMLTTPVIEIHPDGEHAWGMWHTMGCNTQPDFVAHNSVQTAEPELLAMWQQGKYFIDFVKEDGEWKYQNFRWYTNFRTPFDKGWVKQPITGNMSVASKFFPGCPPADGPSHYEPFTPNGLTSYLPIPPPPYTE